MNKGFEVIEACWLFDLLPKDVEVVVHPQSKVHAMVEYTDGSVIAQVSATDMRMPIQYALTYPERADRAGAAPGLVSRRRDGPSILLIIRSFLCCRWPIRLRNRAVRQPQP
jgi:1-deoxy-D-xylulose 5-phosphate reductoisomerase